MKYVITDFYADKTRDFENAEEANKFVQQMYKDYPELYPTVDSIRENAIFIVYEKIGGIYE